MNKFLSLVVSFFILSLVGCQSTKSDSAVNPTLSNYHVSKLAVLAVDSPEIEDIVTTTLQDNGVNATAVRSLLTFAKDEKDFFDQIVKNGYSDILVIKSSVGTRQVSVSGYNTNINTYNTYNGTDSYATTTPITSSTNNALAIATILNVEGIKVWQSKIDLSAGGHLYTDTDSMTEGLSDALIEELQNSSLL
ncbi:hypothetical protein ACPSL1_15730 [Vibrio parahaemolyticus]|uniref:hypothetical protein n=1 Tax=Vibrio TaxID=662 RepID=UPI00237B5BD3|nr:hypothetical protein [Vibrio sp. VP6]MDE0551121.1 hypothetical protein [Vibrio sp. VP6]HCH4062181.1 hypothetical protein [Vibrio parahaemolyticus]